MPRAGLAALRARLLAWWDAGHRDLPWRAQPGAADPYAVWISEVMLQQTQVAAVIPYYRRFLARFPTLESLAEADEDDVLALWSGLGYYARGRRLREAARAALARHGGLPRTAAALRALPGFGPYTAGAVASIAFGEPVPCVDGNVTRVLARVALVDGQPEDAAVRRTVRELAGRLLAPERPGDWNQALMELGATVCVKPVPRCERCPVGRLCAARRAGREREVPPARVRRARRELRAAAALVVDGGALLLARRQGGGLFGGLWEPPSVDVPPGDDPRGALEAALAALGVRAEVGPEVAAVERELTHRRLYLRAHVAALRPDASRPAAPGLRWVLPHELGDLALSTAVRKLLAQAEVGGPSEAGGRAPPSTRGRAREARARDPRSRGGGSDGSAGGGGRHAPE